MSAISLHTVYKSCGKTKIIHGVSCAVDPGEIVGLVGPSGGGKTTIVDMIIGLTVPTAGSIRLLDKAAPHPRACQVMGFIPPRYRPVRRHYRP